MENSFILRNPSENEIINVIDQNMSDICSTTLNSVDKDELLKISPNLEISELVFAFEILGRTQRFYEYLQSLTDELILPLYESFNSQATIYSIITGIKYLMNLL